MSSHSKSESDPAGRWGKQVLTCAASRWASAFLVRERDGLCGLSEEIAVLADTVMDVQKSFPALG